MAVVACDKSHHDYYACIFVKATGNTMHGSNNRPTLLLKGPHQSRADDVIKALLEKLSEDVGNIVSESLRTSQMSRKEWKAFRDLTPRSSARDGAGTSGGNSSNAPGSTSGAGRAQQGNGDLPPAYWK